MAIRTLVVGMGTIGEEVRRRLVAPAWEITGYLTSDRLYEPSGETAFHKSAFDASDPGALAALFERLDEGVVFLCIPTKDQGETALRYIRAAIDAQARIVTAEKGAAAWQFSRIAPHLDRIDLGAAVGGGNAFLYTMRRRHLQGRRVTIRAVFNATLNNLLWQVQGGASLERADGSFQDRNR